MIIIRQMGAIFGSCPWCPGCTVLRLGL